ncbi:hypothetical protein ACNKHM_11490 [Shigella sonnei]
MMAAGQEVLIQDLPGGLFESNVPESTSHMQPDSWATLLAQWADRALRSGHQTRFPSTARAGTDVTDHRAAT